MMIAVKSAKTDVRVMSLIGLAHFFSHFFQLTLPALFPLMWKYEGLNWSELGALSAVLYAASGIAQTPAGFFVDKFGARLTLLVGMLSMSAAMCGFLFVETYTSMIFLAFCAGLGNSVFHPADFSILNGSIDSSRIGRAFSVHHFGGYIGYSSAPFLLLSMGYVIGWRETIFFAGCGGFIVTALIWHNRARLIDCGLDKGIKPENIRKEIKGLIRPSFIMAFLFFTFMAMGSVGMMTLGAGALIQLIDVSDKIANGTISLQLIGTIFGVIAGGYIADRVSRHDYMTAIVVTIGAISLQALPIFQLTEMSFFISILVVFGVLYGIAGPLRDMVIRAITPPGAAGKVFGFTYSGMDVGSALSGVIFGYFLQKGIPEMVFVGVGITMFVGVAIILMAHSMSDREKSINSL